MNSRTLKNELKAFLEKNVYSPEIDQPLKKPNIYIESLPKRKYKEDEEKIFPFILIEAQEGTFYKSSADEKSTFQLSLCIGIDTSKEDNPELESITDNIIHSILEKRIVGDCFEIQDPIKTEYGKDDYAPFYYAGMSLTFTIPSIEDNSVTEILL